MKAGDTYKTKNSGMLTITKWNNKNSIVVMFLKTGFVKKSDSVSISRGNVKDPFCPSVYSFGYIGVGCFNSVKDKVAYKKWTGMLERCYSPKSLLRRPTYSNCTVCDAWLNFQAFALWHYANYPSCGKVWHLDKDIKTKGNKVYSPEFCKYVTPSENTKAIHRNNLNK